MMMRASATLSFGMLATIMIFVTSPIHAHPVSVTRAAIYLTREQANVRIDVFLEDLYLFHQLQPNDKDYLSISDIEHGIKQHEKFLGDRFEITDAEGKRYEPRSVKAIPISLPEEGVPLADLMAHQLHFELQFTFPEPPQVLTFTQRFTDEAAILPSEMTLQIKQENSEGTYDQTVPANQPYSLRIDWNHPPLAPDASEQERSAWEQRQKQTLLGITNYGKVYSFIYIEDFEVRHEILVPLMALEADLSIRRNGDNVLDVVEQDEARQPIAQYFLSGNPLIIDSEAPVPTLQSCHFFGLDMTDFAQLSQPKPVPLANARVGIILSYRLTSRPQSVRMHWNRFNSNLWSVSTVAIAGEKVLRRNLSRLPNRNLFTWERPEEDSSDFELKPVSAASNVPPPIPVPWLSGLFGLAALLLCVRAFQRRQLLLGLVAVTLLFGAFVSRSEPRWILPWTWTADPALSSEEASAVFRQVHANIYHAFSRRTDESIYDALATSVDGSLLRKIYLDVRRSLALEDQGGAIARIRDDEIIEISDQVVRGNSIQLRCCWNVLGTVEHWGHVHRRINQYDAEFVLGIVRGHWKLVEARILKEKRIQSETTLRTI